MTAISSTTTSGNTNAASGTAKEPAFSAESYMERRVHQRQPQQLSTRLLPLGGSLGIRCTCDDLSEGGMHLTVPVGFGIGVGQRCEVGFSLDAARDLDRGTSMDDDTRCYATVVRTRINVAGDTGSDGVGIGLRFDQPIYL